MKIINLYGGPCTGKSATAAGLFFLMKTQGYNVELVTEYAKDKVYEGHLGCLEDQIYIFGKQQRRINRLKGHVDYVISDSPLPLSILYNKDLSSTFDSLVLETFNTYNNINIMLNRSTTYQTVGRTQTEDEAIKLDRVLIHLLDMHEIPFHFVDVALDAPEKILWRVKQYDSYPE